MLFSAVFAVAKEQINVQIKMESRLKFKHYKKALMKGVVLVERKDLCVGYFA